MQLAAGAGQNSAAFHLSQPRRLVISRRDSPRSPNGLLLVLRAANSFPAKHHLAHNPSTPNLSSWERLTMSNGSDALAELQRLEQDQGDLNKQLAIIRISEPISDVGETNPSPSKRGSDISLSNLNDPTPAVLEADLTHYKVRGVAPAPFCECRDR